VQDPDKPGGATSNRTLRSTDRANNADTRSINPSRD
jgi:hypothetical protein